MDFSPQNSLNENLSENEGMVKLWANPNLLKSEWKLTGNFGEDIYHYFFIPSGFIISGGSIKYNFSYKYIKKYVEVYHNGIRQTEDFWRLEESTPETVEIKTDPKTKLPYVMTPSLGRYNFQPEKVYFIPVGIRT